MAGRIGSLEILIIIIDSNPVLLVLKGAPTRQMNDPILKYYHVAKIQLLIESMKSNNQLN